MLLLDLKIFRMECYHKQQYYEIFILQALSLIKKKFLLLVKYEEIEHLANIFYHDQKTRYPLSIFFVRIQWDLK